MTSKFQKSQYYLWYVGWRDCGGVYGRAITEPIVKELVRDRQNEDLPKLTLEVTKKELKIVQLQEKRKNKVERIKYPPVPSKDVTYAVQALPPDEDIVACIYLGYNPLTQSAVHVHVYRCDSRETAAMLVGHLNQLITLPEHVDRVKKIEAELVKKGQITLRPDTYVRQASPVPALTEEMVSSDEGRGSDYSDPPGNAYEATAAPNYLPFNGNENASEMYDNLAEELKKKLKGKDAPILLPAKDYDTVHRIKGNPFERDRRMSNHPAIVGKIAVGESYDEQDEEEEKDAVFPISPRQRSRGHGSVESPRSPVGSRGKSSGSGGSPASPRGGSRDMSSSSADFPNSPMDSGNHFLSSSGGSSGAFRGNSEANEGDLHPVSPRWKTSGQAFYQPPGQSPRRNSSDRHNSSSSGVSKGPSQVWPPPPKVKPKPKPFSPGPYTKELTKKSYFPSSGLPNYSRRHSAENGGPYPSDRRQEMGYGAQPHNGKKYTAASLGLTEGTRAYATSDPRRDRTTQQRAQPPREDRYMSLDRRELQYDAVARGHGLPRSYVTDDPRGAYPSNHTGYKPTRTASFN